MMDICCDYQTVATLCFFAFLAGVGVALVDFAGRQLDPAEAQEKLRGTGYRVVKEG